MVSNTKYIEDVLVNEYVRTFYKNGKPNNLIGAIFKRIKNTEDREDFIQETFIKFLKNLDKIKERNIKLTTAVYTIGYSVARDGIRGISNRKEYGIDEIFLKKSYDFSNFSYDFNSNPQEIIEKKEYGEKIKETLLEKIGKMPEKLRDIFIHRWFNGESYSDIAEIMDLPLGTIKSRLNEAKKLLLYDKDLEEVVRMD